MGLNSNVAGAIGLSSNVAGATGLNSDVVRFYMFVGK